MPRTARAPIARGGYKTIYGSNGEAVAELVVYYSLANGSTNTVCMRHLNDAHGKKLEPGVRIWKCGSYYNCRTVDPYGSGWAASDESSYAGPVSVTGTASRCVAVHGYMIDPYNRVSCRERVLMNVGCAAS